MGLPPKTTWTNFYVNDLAECDIIVEAKDIVKKSKDDAARLSFKISVPAQDLQKALDPTIWPLRVKVREYVYYPKKKSNDNEEKASGQPSHPPKVHLHAPNDGVTPIPVANRFSSLELDAAAAHQGQQ